MKKILQIKKGEYLHSILNEGAIDTTYHKEFAMDIKNWSLEQLGYIVENLKKVGYVDAEVLTIVDEVVEVVEEIGEKTSESAKKIGEALQDVKKRVEDA
jgi:hypothetical protein